MCSEISVCYLSNEILSFAVTQIVFDNRAHSGKIKVDVENDVRIYECRDWNVEGTCKFLPKLMQ